MARNGIQFQNGLSLLAFLRLYGTEEQCEAALEKARWPDAFQCPRCGAQEYSLVYGRRLMGYQVPILRPSGHPHGRHDHAGCQTAKTCPGLSGDIEN